MNHFTFQAESCMLNVYKCMFNNESLTYNMKHSDLFLVYFRLLKHMQIRLYEQFKKQEAFNIINSLYSVFQV